MGALLPRNFSRWQHAILHWQTCKGFDRGDSREPQEPQENGLTLTLNTDSVSPPVDDGLKA